MRIWQGCDRMVGKNTPQNTTTRNCLPKKMLNKKQIQIGHREPFVFRPTSSSCDPSTLCIYTIRDLYICRLTHILVRAQPSFSNAAPAPVQGPALACHNHQHYVCPPKGAMQAFGEQYKRTSQDGLPPPGAKRSNLGKRRRANNEDGYSNYSGDGDDDLCSSSPPGSPLVWGITGLSLLLLGANAKSVARSVAVCAHMCIAHHAHTNAHTMHRYTTKRAKCAAPIAPMATRCCAPPAQEPTTCTACNHSTACTP